MANFNVEIVGNALNDMGLSANNAIDGTGLNTFGFLWSDAAIWTKSDSNITTNWSLSQDSISTTWAWSDTSISTTWQLAE